jgi:ribose transport system ATP-binding protein
MRGVEKRFGAVRALSGVDLELRPAEVHALIGENGAGKSTLMKVLAGALAPDDGEMRLDGEPYRPKSPLDARRRGVAMIYQELTLAPQLSVEANVMLGRETHRAGILDRRSMRRRARAALTELGHSSLDPRRPVAELGPATRQIVEIARALAHDARIVILDEPTSSLSKPETEQLFSVMRRLRDRGLGLIYISHFLDEVARIADRFTVLRDGRSVGSGPMREVSTASLIERMAGRAIDEAFPRVPHEPGPPLAEAAQLRGRRLPREASLVLHRGEILGIAGLVGAGRTELLRVLFGLDPLREGRITIDGVTDQGRPPATRLAQGMGLVSEDRKDEGLALSMSIADNVTLSRPRPFAPYGVLRKRARTAVAERFVEQLGIRCRSVNDAVSTLSGGNQQKVAIARLLHHDVDIALLDEPTRGIDVGSKVEVYRLMGELAARSKAVVFVSSYVPELLGVADRIAVMHRGVLGPPRAAAEWTEAAILDEAARGAEEGA